MDERTERVLIEFIETIRGALVWYFVLRITQSYDQSMLNQLLWTFGKDPYKEGE